MNRQDVFEPQDICDICEELTPMLFRHPFRELMVCLECRNDAIDSMDLEYEALKERVGRLYIRDEIKQIKR